MMKRFNKKTVIVTGADSGIGEAVAVRFAQEGADVVLVGKNMACLEDTIDQMPQDRTWIKTDHHIAVAANVSKEEDMQHVLKRTLQDYKHIDVLVNTADIDNAELNLNHIQQTCALVMPYLAKVQGNIINISYISDRTNQEVINISQMTHEMAKDKSSDGVRINSVKVNIDNFTDIAASKRPDTETTIAHYRDLNRTATPEDVAAAITFLASDEAIMISGVNLPVASGVVSED